MGHVGCSWVALGSLLAALGRSWEGLGLACKIQSNPILTPTDFGSRNNSKMKPKSDQQVKTIAKNKRRENRYKTKITLSKTKNIKKPQVTFGPILPNLHPKLNPRLRPKNEQTKLTKKERRSEKSWKNTTWDKNQLGSPAPPRQTHPFRLRLSQQLQTLFASSKQLSVILRAWASRWLPLKHHIWASPWTATSNSSRKLEGALRHP